MFDIVTRGATIIFRVQHAVPFRGRGCIMGQMVQEMYDEILRRKAEGLGVTPSEIKDDFNRSLIAQGIAPPGGTPEKDRMIALQMMPD